MHFRKIRIILCLLIKVIQFLLFCVPQRHVEFLPGRQLRQLRSFIHCADPKPSNVPVADLGVNKAMCLKLSRERLG
jgi:hypothetical protein